MSRAYWLLLPMLVLAGCSGDRGVRCESDERYQSARSVAPIRVPDDLNVPDESGALDIPPPRSSAERTSASGTCLERPPDYFAEDEQET